MGAAQAGRLRAFAMAFQQFCAPVAAKGVEVRGCEETRAAAHGLAVVAELDREVVEDLRQVAVGLGTLTHQVGDHFLVGRAEQHLTLVAVGDAQHLLAIGIIAAGGAPQVGRLDGRHKHFDGAGAVHLFANNALDLGLECKPERKPGVDARRGPANVAGPQQ